jgi:hypothetical protein
LSKAVQLGEGFAVHLSPAYGRLWRATVVKVKLYALATLRGMMEFPNCFLCFNGSMLEMLCAHTTFNIFSLKNAFVSILNNDSAIGERDVDIVKRDANTESCNAGIGKRDAHIPECLVKIDTCDVYIAARNMHIPVIYVDIPYTNARIQHRNAHIAI